MFDDDILKSSMEGMGGWNDRMRLQEGEKLYPLLFIDPFDSLTKGVNIWKF